MNAIVLMDKTCPDLVITDIRMPQCDEIELIKYLQKKHPSVKAIILSGYDDFTYAQTAIKCGTRDYLLKPVSLEALLESLQKLLITFNSASQELETYRSSASRMDQKTICKLLEKYLHEHNPSDISFQELAYKFGFTPEYLGKIFKKQTEETPSKYLTCLRMNEAKRLLLSNPGMEIQQVGKLVGYKDGFYFSRAFKSFTGIQPSEFRKQH